MSTRAYKATIAGLVTVAVLLGWKCWSLSGQAMTGAFVSHQAEILRQDLKDANAVEVRRDSILHDLDWYLGYYDTQTNTLAGSAVMRLLWIERQYVVRDTIAYLRKTGTNDFGDDPYNWLRHEYAH